MPTIPSVINMLVDLIGTPSISSSDPRLDMGNRAVSELIAEWCESLGFSVALQPVPSREGHFNVVATAGAGPGGLVLAGHTDTVPMAADRWTSDPFRLREADGRLYGLGTSDMKGFFALVLTAASRFDLHRLAAPLTIVATADEETGMAGARQLARSGVCGAHAVIGEPTGMRPVRMHKGNLMERLRLTGQTGHSSNPAYGNSALEGMHLAMSALLGFRAELQAGVSNPAFEVAVPTLNLGCIHGGDNPNRICGSCELAFDLRLLPGQDGAAIREALREHVRDALDGSRLGVEFEVILDVVPGMETPASMAIVAAVEEISGIKAGPASFATEAPFYRAAGMDVVLLGPGDIQCAHQPDEFLAADRLAPATDQLSQLISRFCLVGQSG